jgi:hypothetical protein
MRGGDEDGGARGRWWSRTRGLPVEVFEAWRASLPAGAQRKARVLAWAQAGPEPATAAYCVGSQSVWSWGGASGFQHICWHDIQSGGWNGETRWLSWQPYPSSAAPIGRSSIELQRPGRVPELFRERVAASIVLERFLPYGGGSRGVTVSARRDLGGTGDAIYWHLTLSRGLTWNSDGVSTFADAALAVLKSEFGPA